MLPAYLFAELGHVKMGPFNLFTELTLRNYRASLKIIESADISTKKLKVKKYDKINIKLNRHGGT